MRGKHDGVHESCVFCRGSCEDQYRVMSRCHRFTAHLACFTHELSHVVHISKQAEANLWGFLASHAEGMRYPLRLIDGVMSVWWRNYESLFRDKETDTLLDFSFDLQDMCRQCRTVGKNDEYGVLMCDHCKRLYYIPYPHERATLKTDPTSGHLPTHVTDQ